MVYTTIGRTVILECRVRNLGNRAVSPCLDNSSELKFFSFRCLGSGSLTSTSLPWERRLTPTVSSSCQHIHEDQTSGISGFISYLLDLYEWKLLFPPIFVIFHVISNAPYLLHGVHRQLFIWFPEYTANYLFGSRSTLPIIYLVPGVHRQ